MDKSFHKTQKAIDKFINDSQSRQKKNKNRISKIDSNPTSSEGMPLLLENEIPKFGLMKSINLENQ